MGNKEFIQSLYAAFAKSDVPSVLAGLDDKIEWSEAEGFPFWNGAPFVGPQEVAERVFARIGKGELSDTFAVNPSQFVADGDTVVMLGTYTGTGSSGAPFEVKVAHVWTVRGGKAVTFQQHVDTLKVREALGS
jgi:ketosteroid isomerase-like protein